MGRAVVIGANGQDGAFLVGHLCRRGYTVLGLGRQETFRHARPAGGFSYAGLDLRDDGELSRIIADQAPDLVFHVAALHGAAGTQYEPVFRDMQAVNTGSVHVVLEQARLRTPNLRLVYASSLKAFGDQPSALIDETSPRVSSCLYSITKNASHDLIGYYRHRHGVKASVLLLFNHESPLRPDGFFMPRIIDLLARALAGDSTGGEVHTLDFNCDWGDAVEFMDIAVDVAERVPGDDFVLASGKTWYARDFVAELFAHYRLDWREYVRERVATDTARGKGYQASVEKLRSRLGRVPQRDVFAIAQSMLAARNGKYSA